MNHDAASSLSLANGIASGYEEALRTLCHPVSKAAYPPDLTPLKALLAQMGHPEKAFRSVIITGSVGKGTVAHLLAESLRQAGLRTGLFSGPHLYNFRERMAIDGQPIGISALVEQVARLKSLITGDTGHLSTFELATALGFNWFASQGVEIAVLEVGIGGRYDAVNLAPAESAILMPIELEHTVLLGNSLAQIAHHKAGVIPEGGFVITAPQPPEALEVITATCRERHASLLKLSREADWEMTNGHNAYHVSIGDVALEGETPLLGRHNALNIATVLAWGVEAAGRDYPIAPAHVAGAARDLHMVGRVELVNHEGVSLMIDGAHTPTGATALADTLDSLPGSGSRTYIVGISRDKNAAGFLTALRIPRDASLVLTTYKGHRAMPLEDLAGLAPEANAGLNVQTTPHFADALDQAMARHRNGGLIVVTGSLHMAAQTRERLGLLTDEALAEARLTRAVFSGPDYLALVDGDRSDETTPQPST
jgi:dihydrofolate synthase/folylpolyglutamate synthase